MANLREYETAAHIGCLDDECFGVDHAGDAHGLRELRRNHNAYISRPQLLYTWHGAAQESYGEAPGGGWSFANPYWSYILPTPLGGFPIPHKPQGYTLLRLMLRAVLTLGKQYDLAVGTLGRPFSPSTAYAQVTGTGTSQLIKHTFPMRDAPGELFNFHVRADVDHHSDSTLLTGTYGGTATGTVITARHDGGGLMSFTSAGAAWNTTGDTVHRGGHYVMFTAVGDGRVLWGPCPVVSVTDTGNGLFVKPALFGAPIISLWGQTYTIYKLPDLRLLSVVCYGERGT